MKTNTREADCLHKKSYAALWLAALIVPTLGHATDYQEPTSGPTASIEFVDDSPQKISIHFYADEKECTDRTNSWAKPNEQKNISVAADKDVAFTVGMDPKGASAVLAFGAIGALVGANIYKGCTPTLDFHPVQGHNYVFRITTDGKDCNYKFYEKPATEATNPNEELPVTFTEREWFRAWGNSGPWCKKQSTDKSTPTE